MNITSGKIKTAQKVVIYGPEGIGKSTFASQFPNPVFIDTEGSTNQLDVRRFDKPTSWQMLKKQVEYVLEQDCGQTLVIDTVDWAEQMCLEYICAIHDKKGIEDFGYGNGYVYEKEEFGKFLNLLQDVVDSGVNVVLTAHAQLRKFEQPDELGAYDRWELKLGKKTASQISPLVKEWADMVLFANYKTFAIQTDKDGKKFKAQGGSRIMYTQHHPCWDAKNRFGLSDEIPFDYKEIAFIFDKEEKKQPEPKIENAEIPVINEPKAEEPTVEIIPDVPKGLADLMKEYGVTEDDIKLAVSGKGYYPYDTPIKNYDINFINGVLIGAWDQVYAMIKNNKEKHPFAG